MTRGERLVDWLLAHLPQRVAAAPERILLNTAVALIGLAALVGLAVGTGPRPSSLLTLWPGWLSWEWAAAMLAGGSCALVGYLRGRRSTERFGYLLTLAAAALYGVSVLVVFEVHGIFSAVIYLGIACAKAIRLAVTSAARASIIRGGDRDDRP